MSQTATVQRITIDRSGTVSSLDGSTRHRRRDRINITNNNIVYLNEGTQSSSHHPYISNRRHTRFHNFGSFNLHWGFNRHHRRIRPRYGRVAYYRYGSHHDHHFGLSYIYPNYHRRYLFVSFGGYWPIHYRYRRYYWYGCHPHRWYGTYPKVYQPTSDTYNTYNYYYDDTTDSTYSTNDQFDDFSDIREKLQLEKLADSIEESDEPLAESISDIYFDEGIKAFEKADYEKAMQKFRQAIELVPNDMILPFAYCQALFANSEYAQAASVLRETLSKIPEDNPTVFYPRGLYKEDEVLNQQIELLKKKIEKEPFGADLNLLLGYQLMGVDEFEKASESLQKAKLVSGNEEAVNILVELIEKIKTDNADESEKQINLN